MLDSGGLTGSTEVTTSALLDDATALSRLSDELTSAFDLAGHVTVTADAYGETCARVASMLNAVADAGGKAVKAGIDALDSEVTKLRASAGTYDENETARVEVFTETSGELG